jgi:hypothetical protein
MGIMLSKVRQLPVGGFSVFANLFGPWCAVENYKHMAIPGLFFQ